MALATPAVDVPGSSTALMEEVRVWGIRLLCWMADSGRRGDPSRTVEAGMLL